MRGGSRKSRGTDFNGCSERWNALDPSWNAVTSVFLRIWLAADAIPMGDDSEIGPAFWSMTNGTQTGRVYAANSE